jgi:outer membrane lipoprotein carrier protein
MNKIIHITCFFLISLSANAQLQKDPEARKILDKFSARSVGDYPVQIHFEYTNESLMDQEKYTETGSLILLDDKFRLKIGEADIYCNGETIWNHLTTADEVYLSDAEDAGGDDFFISSPQELFIFYKDNFKYQLKDEITYQTKQLYQIYLYPDDLNGSYHTIKLLINKDDFRLYSAEALGKHGVNHTLLITDYTKKVKTEDTTFMFTPGDYPDIEVIDTRF